MQNLLAKIRRFFDDLLHTLLRTPQYRAELVEDQPEQLESNVVYLIGDPHSPWSAAMLCPCGCRAEIRISLIPNDDPRWRVSRNWRGAVSLQPSIWRNKGCRSHFFLTRGNIHWARPSPLQRT